MKKTVESMPLKYSTVSEGGLVFKVPVVEKLLRKNPVFYNPLMELSRDLSVAVARVINPPTFCDALAGSGVRGLRVAKEAGVSVTLNDLNPLACELMRENALANGLDVEVSNDDLNHMLSGRKFDFVDVDPFGPPVRYLDSAVRAMPKRGWLGVAATDTSALCGTYPRACWRKYDAVSLKTDYYNELGLRILLGYIARNSVRYDFGVRFLFSYCSRHYFRVFVELVRSRVRVRETQGSLGFIQHCFGCLRREYRGLDALTQSCSCGEHLKTAGSLYTGEFADPKFCGKLAKELDNENFRAGKEARALVSAVAAEQAVGVPYYNLHKLCKRLGVAAPKSELVRNRLVEAGFMVSRTHFEPLGVRTDADVRFLSEILTA